MICASASFDGERRLRIAEGGMGAWGKGPELHGTSGTTSQCRQPAHPTSALMIAGDSTCPAPRLVPAQSARRWACAISGVAILKEPRHSRDKYWIHIEHAAEAERADDGEERADAHLLRA